MNLRKLATVIGLAGVDIGEVETIQVGPNYTTCNITVQVEHEEQLSELLEAIHKLEGGFRIHTVSVTSLLTKGRKLE